MKSIASAIVLSSLMESAKPKAMVGTSIGGW
jgi:hypothetical protein